MLKAPLITMNKKFIYLRNISTRDYPNHVLINIKKDTSEKTLKVAYKATNKELTKIYWFNENRITFNREMRRRGLYEKTLPFKKPNNIPSEYLRKNQKLYRLHI